MKRTILLADVAEEDIERTYKWYSARSVEQARRYLQVLSITLDYLSEKPLGSSRIRGRIRQFPLKGFPFVVVFAVYSNEILIRRVFHTRQNPRHKLRSEG